MGEAVVKTYSEYMKEISGQELYKALLGYGLFPEKLPPIFSSEEFYNYCILNKPSYAGKARQYVYYESMRNINIPRQMGIPVPMAYQKLCSFVSDIWESELIPHFERKTSNQDFRVSRIHVRKMKNSSAVFEMSYKNWKTDDSPEESILMNMKYVVRADISKCFPSIYTHSLAWALVGKDKAKRTKGDRKYFYNKLDHLVQINKDLETHGLLIGPHISNILAEIILCSVDYELVSKGFKYIRNIDDYTAYVETEKDAEMFLVALQEELRKYDLSINHKKTKIEKLPLAMTEQWTRRIVPVSILTSYKMVDYKNCRAYLDSAIEIAESEQWNSAVLNWAIKVLSSFQLTNNAKQYEKHMVFHLAIMYPYLVPLLEDYVFSKCDVMPDEVKELSCVLYNNGIKSKKYEQASYALYYSIKYGFCLDVKIDDIIKSGDCILLSVALMYFRKKRDGDSEKELVKYAETLEQSPVEGDFDQNWIFVYEALSQEQLHDEWKNIKRSGVSFFVDP